MKNPCITNASSKRTSHALLDGGEWPISLGKGAMMCVIGEGVLEDLPLENSCPGFLKSFQGSVASCCQLSRSTYLGGTCRSISERMEERK